MYARQMEQETDKQAWEQEKFDKEWASRAQIARMQGEYGNEQARIMADARVSAAGSGDGTGWQYDENLAKKFAEDYIKLIDGTPELRKKYEKAWVPDALGGFDRKRLEIDAAAAGREAASMVASKRVSGDDAFNFVGNKVFFAGARGGGDGASPKPFNWNDPKDKEKWQIAFANRNQTATPAQIEAAFTNAKAEAEGKKKGAPGPVDAVDEAATGTAVTGPVEPGKRLPAPIRAEIFKKYATGNPRTGYSIPPEKRQAFENELRAREKQFIERRVGAR